MLDLSGPKNATPPPAGKTRTAGGRKPANTAKLASEKTAERESGLVGLGQIACVPLMLTGNMADCGAVAMHWPGVAHETAVIAETNANVARVVDFVTAVGPFAGLLAAIMPLTIQIMVNHNRIPMHPALAQFGVVAPDVMKAQAQAQAAREAADMMRMQREAEQELRDAMADVENSGVSLDLA
jgi:hypothetical protein